MSSTVTLGRRLAALAAVVLALVAGCSNDDGSVATTAPLLNSERIEQRFGSYGIEVLAQDDATRVSDLYSGSGSDRITRTFAVVTYPDSIDPAIADVHATIVAGGSIGSTFRDAGWTIDKEDVYVGSLPAPDVPSVANELMDIQPQDLALHIYRFDVSLDDETIRYATIAEIHHPAYLTADDLRSIFGDGAEVGLDPDEIDAIAKAAANI